VAASNARSVFQLLSSVSCSPSRYHKSLFGILIAVIVLIIYGSLYPWVFEARQLPASPLYILLTSWDIDLHSRRFLSDVAVNIAIYTPLGMSAHLAFRRFKSVALEFLGPVVLGTLLSGSIEMLQLFTPGRQCSAVDLVNNILGSVLGVFAGFAFTEIVDFPATGQGVRVRDKNAVAMLFCWVALLLFPFFPVLSLGVWRAKITGFLQAPLFSPVLVLLSLAEWFAVGRLLVSAGAKRPLRWLLLLLVLVPVQFAIVDHNPVPADFVGPVLAVLLFLFFGRGPRANGLAGIVLLIALTLRGLEPFHFEGPPQEFSWIPFAGLLGDTWQFAISTLLGKLFQYGTSLWLLSRARLRRSELGLPRATILVTIVLAAIEALQTRIPGHVPEINDPLLAVLLGLGFSVLRDRRPPDREHRNREHRTGDRAAEPPAIRYIDRQSGPYTKQPGRYTK
jgi:VanZ family protein